MNSHAQVKMNVDQYLKWCETQPFGHFELINGEVVQMSPERSLHNLTKLQVANALSAAIANARVNCVAYTDGMGVRIDKETLLEPDASIQLGGPLDNDALELSAPVVVVEVLSPSTAKNDVTVKLRWYLTVESIVHYLIVDAVEKTVLHHRRISSTECETRIFIDGMMSLDPPGIVIPVAAFFGKV